MKQAGSLRHGQPFTYYYYHDCQGVRLTGSVSLGQSAGRLSVLEEAGGEVADFAGEGSVHKDVAGLEAAVVTQLTVVDVLQALKRRE